jgi:biopolymer transport protein ExbD
MKTRLYILLFVIAAAILPTLGCATAGRNTGSATVTLSNDGRIHVGTTYTGLRKLVAQLKANGITPATRITVEIPQNTSPNAIAAITRELSNNGYRRLIFSKPRRAISVKGSDPLTKHLDTK